MDRSALAARVNDVVTCMVLDQEIAPGAYLAIDKLTQSLARISRGRGSCAERIRPVVLEAIDMFGVVQAMFASNFPVDKLDALLGILYGAFRSLTARFSAAVQHRLFYANAGRVYRN